MDFDYVFDYIGKNVKLILSNNYFYKGLIIDVKTDSLILKDITGKRVVLELNSIILLEEIQNDN